MKIAAGMRVWIDTPTHSGAGPGWPEGHAALAIAVDGPWVIVADSANREIRLPHYDLLAGFEFRGKEGWVPETDPRVLDWLEKHIRKLEAERWQSAVERDRLATIAGHREILRRNGRAPAV